MNKNGLRLDTVETSGSTAVAYPNIALVKYWGKRDEALVLPHTSSLSMTLNVFPTTTRVRLIDAPHDQVAIDGQRVSGEAGERVTRFLDVVRRRARTHTRAEVHSTTSGPIAAGLASSAAGFAALAVAAAAAYEIHAGPAELARLARLGSGSACRSVFGGFAVWHAGTGEGEIGSRTSVVEPVETPLPDPAMVVAMVERGPKPVSSRTAMRHTVATSPLYRAWAEQSERDCADAIRALSAGDLAGVGAIAECNALGMHAAILAARPPVRYLRPTSLLVLDRIEVLRAQGIPAYATIDAGPNVVVWCHREDAPRVATELSSVSDSVHTTVAHPGPGATLTTVAALHGTAQTRSGSDDRM